MSAAYLLNTNALSDLIRHPSGAVAGRIADIGEDNICTSTIVAGELRFGAATRASERLTRQLNAILSRMTIVGFEAPMDETYAAIRVHLERSGTPIGGNDLLIAAQARCLNLIVVTANVKEFSRVPDLAVETWM